MNHEDTKTRSHHKATYARKPQASPLSFIQQLKGPGPPPEQRKSEAEPTRPGALAGGKPFCDERSRLEQKGFPPAGGDRTIADSSAVNPRYGRFGAARSSACICVICGFLVWADGLRVFVSSCLRRGMVGGSAPLRLRASALCFSGFHVRIGVSYPRLIGS